MADIIFKRKIYSKLKEWKETSKGKTALLLEGARRIGKSTIVEKFAQKEYRSYILIDFNEASKGVKGLFDDLMDMDYIFLYLQNIYKTTLYERESVIIFDEVQQCPKARQAIKYLIKDGRYDYIETGSLISIKKNVENILIPSEERHLNMYPMDFEEFLCAMSKTQLLQLLGKKDWACLSSMQQMLTELLRQYYFVGGMPEAVKAYVERGDIWEVRAIQNKIITAYRNDMSKHAPLQQVQRINMVWNSIPSQLARDNKKFIYGALKKGARANDFEIAIQWLIDAGLVYKVHRVNKAALPLKFYEDMSAFKLFLLDSGLLGALSETPPQQMLIGNNVFEEYKGAFTENYVLQQLKSLPHTFIYYYSNDNSTLEIDFVVQHNTSIIPVEVKAEENLRAKSLRQFTTDNPTLHGLRFSMSGYREQDWMTNVPLWAVRWAL